MPDEVKIQEIYYSLNESEKYGIRFGLFPLRIKDAMEKYNVSAVDLMDYDKKLRPNDEW